MDLLFFCFFFHQGKKENKWAVHFVWFGPPAQSTLAHTYTVEATVGIRRLSCILGQKSCR